MVQDISLKAARTLAGFTQHGAAAAMGVSQATLSQWENGKTCPSAIDFMMLCRLYHVSADSISLPMRTN